MEMLLSDEIFKTNDMLNVKKKILSKINQS